MNFNSLFIETILFDHKTPLATLISSLLQSATSQSATAYFSTNCDPLFIAKCDNFITRCERYYKLRRLLQIAKGPPLWLLCVVTSWLAMGRDWKRKFLKIEGQFSVGPDRPVKEDHLLRFTTLTGKFPPGPNRSIYVWTEISGNFCIVKEPHDFFFISVTVTAFEVPYEVLTFETLTLVQLPGWAVLNHELSNHFKGRLVWWKMKNVSHPPCYLKALN